MAYNRLTDRRIAAAKERGYYADGGNLYLQVSKYGTKSWVFRYAVVGKTRDMGLGGFPQITLKLARELAREQREHLLRGDDPIDVRQGKRDRLRAAAAKRKTFAECADDYISAHADAWRNDKHRKQWKVTLETYAFPVMGKLPVDAIDLPHILRVLEPIWREKPETASRLRGRIERILSWATVRKYRKGENPARWSGHLSEMLPAKTKVRKPKHHAALPFAEMSDFMAVLRRTDGISARALEFTILTAARTGEVITSRWDEIDFDEAVWSVPAARMKSNRPHRVPLSKRAIELLRAMPRDSSGYIFPGSIAGKPISNTAMLKLLTDMRSGLTVHGFRSAFSDWARERTAYPRDVIEMCLAHTIKDKSEAAYRRGDALEKRRRLMESWSQYCDSPATGATVTTLRRA
jgi:integrase